VVLSATRLAMLALSITQFSTVDKSGGLREYSVDGTTFSPHGSVTSADGKDASVDLQSEPVQRLAEISVLCNDARVVYNAVRHCVSLRRFIRHNESVSRTRALIIILANLPRQL
jgi:hypothetical protein